MKTASLFTFSIILLTSIIPCTLLGATQAFLRLDGIEGGSVDKQHAGEMDVLAFEFGVTQTGTEMTGGGGGAGEAQFSDFTVTKRLDKASPKLYQACAGGQHIAEAVFVVRRSGDQPVEYYKVTMQDVLVTSVQTSGDTEDGSVPLETLSLTYRRIEWEFVPTSETGSPGESVSSGWDIAENRKL